MIKFTEYQELQSMDYSKRAQISVEFQSDYALKTEATIVASVFLKDILVRKPWEDPRAWVYQDALRNLPDDFFPTWAPV